MSAIDPVLRCQSSLASALFPSLEGEGKLEDR